MTMSESREQALRIVFQKMFSPELSVEEIAELNFLADDTETNEFASALANSTTDNLGVIDAVISSKLVNWTLERLPKVSLSILRLAVAELLFYGKTADGVVANEAVEFAKKYLTPKEAGFINGVLGAVIRDKEAGAGLPEAIEVITAQEITEEKETGADESAEQPAGEQLSEEEKEALAMSAFFDDDE